MAGSMVTVTSWLIVRVLSLLEISRWKALICGNYDRGQIREEQRLYEIVEEMLWTNEPHCTQDPWELL
jgi:hypothetical protein